MKYTSLLVVMLSTAVVTPAFAVEKLVGEAKIKPGVIAIFEAAPKDTVMPAHGNLPEKETDIHLEARLNWDSEDKAVRGAPAGGFVPYATVKVSLKNEKTGKSASYVLLPHVNLGDNLHYALNIKLPGAREDLYTVAYDITPPKPGVVNFHHDWMTEVKSTNLFEPTRATFKHVDFKEVAEATRR